MQQAMCELPRPYSITPSAPTAVPIASPILMCSFHCIHYKLLVTKIRKLIVTYVEIKYQLDATEVFIADLIACSTCFGHHYAHHQELKSIIQRLLPVVFRAVVFQVAGLVWS